MIFNLFKSKPTLKELIPDGFVDIHSHILPGIDDGAKNIEESLELISKMKNLGFSKIIATPHTYNGLYNNTNDSIKKAYRKLKSKKINNIKLDFASEYMLDDTIIEKARDNSLLCIKDNYLLVEMSYMSAPNNLFEIIYELQVNGYTPVLAHPERYRFFHSNFKKFLRLKKIGCLFQANILSSVDFYGEDIRRFLDKLLQKGMIDFVGSDIHNTSHVSKFNQKKRIKNIELFKKVILRNRKFE